MPEPTGQRSPSMSQHDYLMEKEESEYGARWNIVACRKCKSRAILPATMPIDEFTKKDISCRFPSNQ